MRIIWSPMWGSFTACTGTLCEAASGSARVAGRLRLGPTTDVKRKFSTEPGFRGKAQPGAPQPCPWAASVARSSWGCGLAWRRAHGWPSCSASPKVRTTLCQFQRGKQALSPKLAGQRGPGRRERRGRLGGEEMRAPARCPAPAQTSARGGSPG